MHEGRGWIVEAEVRGYFDSIDRTCLREVLRKRVNEGRILRLMGQGLRAGGMDHGERTHPETGVVQGGVLSPVLANIFGRLFGRTGTVSLMIPYVGRNVRPHSGAAWNQAPCCGQLPEDSASRARDATPQEANVLDRTRRVSRLLAKTRRDNRRTHREWRTHGVEDSDHGRGILPCVRPEDHGRAERPTHLSASVFMAHRGGNTLGSPPSLV
jgi:hypothetical protein